MRRDPYDERQTPDRGRLPADQQAQALREALAEARADAQKAIGELKALSGRYVELQQDLSRYRSKVAEMAEEAQRVGREAVLLDLVGVADDLERSLAVNPDKNSAWAQGTAAILDGVLRRLEQHGVRRYGAQGDRFDPALHEAVGAVEDTPFAADTIVGIERAGYLVGADVLRPANVIVSR